MRRLALLLGLSALLLPRPATGQAECASADCPLAVPAAQGHSQLWAFAAQVHQHKLDFVAAIQAFARAQAGTFGDEGPRLIGAADEMSAALGRWDAAIERLRLESSRLGPVPDAYLARATVYLERLRVDDAIRELANAARLDPERPDVHSMHALAYATAGRHADAARALRRAVAIAPNDPALLYALATQSALSGRVDDALEASRSFTRVVHRQITATRSAPGRLDRIALLRQAEGVAPVFPRRRYAVGFDGLRVGDYRTAVARLRDAAERDPLNIPTPARAGLRTAAASLREGQVDRAIATLEALVAATPDDAEVRRVLGFACWLAEQPERAVAELSAAVRLRPDDERAAIALAEVLTDAGRTADAERVLLEAAGGESPSGEALVMLSRAYEAQSRLPEALEAIERAERIGAIAGQDALYASIGRILVNQAGFDGAVAAYRRRLDVNPNHADAHRILGDVFFLRGRHEEALAEFSAAIWIDPRNARAHAGAGQVYARTQEYAEAVGALRRALALDARATGARYALATALLRVGRRDEAAGELARVAREQEDERVHGQRAFARETLRHEAEAASAAGRHDDARAALQALLSVDAGDAAAHRHLAAALLAGGHAAEAATALERAQQLEPTAEAAAALAEAYAATGRMADSRAQLAQRDQLLHERRRRRLTELAAR